MGDQPLRRNRQYVALWLGQAASALGTSISTLSYPLLVLWATGSAGFAGLIGSVQAATAFVVRVPAGALADRVDRRRLMLLCDAGRFLIVASVAVAVWADHVRLGHLLAVAVVEGTLGALFAPAEAAAVRRVVTPGQVADAVAANQSRQQVAALAGPAVGGALFGAGRALPFAADALSYLLSFGAVATIRRPLGVPRGRHGGVLAGLRWLWRHRFLRAASLWLSCAGALFSSMGLVTMVLAAANGARPAEVGAMFTLAGLGGVAGGLTAPWLLRRCRARVVLAGYGWIATAATFALLAAGSVGTLGLVGAVAFFPVPAVTALVLSRVAVDVPEALHGRAVTATTQLTGLLQPVGPAAAGLTIDVAGTTPFIVGTGVVFTVLALIATLAGWPDSADRLDHHFGR